MNSLTIIGNLTADPTSRNVNGANGVATVCNFTVAANRHAGGRKITDFFRVACWGKLGENCMKYLLKGRPVAVVGSVSASAYNGNDGKPHASLEVMAEKVEFLSGRAEERQQAAPQEDEYVPPMDDDSLPF